MCNIYCFVRQQWLHGRASTLRYTYIDFKTWFLIKASTYQSCAASHIYDMAYCLQLVWRSYLGITLAREIFPLCHRRTVHPFALTICISVVQSPKQLLPLFKALSHMVIFFLNPHNPSLLPSDHLRYPSSQLQLTQLAGQVARSL